MSTQILLSHDETPLSRRIMNAPLTGSAFDFLLIKLASRCNINCTYCYWFRDEAVYRKPPVLTIEAEDALCDRLENHIRTFELDMFSIVFHGGEPLLFPKRRFRDLHRKLLDIETRTGCEISCGVCTNGLLIDDEWAEILREAHVDVSISIDGPPEIHDKYRIDFKGNGTHAGTLRGIERLRAAGVDPAMIVVCNPETDPADILSYVVNELGVTYFDILPPDANHTDAPPPIDEYFIRLFDLWYDEYAELGVRIRTLDALIRGVLGELSMSDTIGLGAIETVTLMTDGSLEPLDVLRIAGDGFTETEIRVQDHALQHVQTDPRWREAFVASTSLCSTCKECEYADACGGGHLAHRWSPERGYDNPSVYCESWKKILDHIWYKLAPTLVLDLQAPDSVKNDE